MGKKVAKAYPEFCPPDIRPGPGWKARWVKQQYMLEKWSDPLYAARQKKALAHDKRGRREGDIVGLTREEARRLRKQALRRAERVLKKMEDEGLIDPEDVNDVDRTKANAQAEGIVDNESAAARAAMKEVLVQVFLPGSKKDKLAAARTVLEYTKAKPTSKSDLNVSAPEDFLMALLKKETEGD